MGCKDIHTEAISKYFKDTRAPTMDANRNAAWKIMLKCLCCCQLWTSIIGSKKIVHITCIAGCGIATCTQTYQKICNKEKEVLYLMFAAGKQYLFQ